MPGCLDLSYCPPDMGPHQAQPRSGVVTIGAVPWIINYNVPLATSDMAAARRVARAVSERGGGLPGVEVCAEDARTERNTTHRLGPW